MNTPHRRRRDRSRTHTQTLDALAPSAVLAAAPISTPSRSAPAGPPLPAGVKDRAPAAVAASRHPNNRRSDHQPQTLTPLTLQLTDYEIDLVGDVLRFLRGDSAAAGQTFEGVATAALRVGIATLRAELGLDAKPRREAARRSTTEASA